MTIMLIEMNNPVTGDKHDWWKIRGDGKISRSAWEIHYESEGFRIFHTVQEKLMFLSACLWTYADDSNDVEIRDAILQMRDDAVEEIEGCNEIEFPHLDWCGKDEYVDDEGTYYGTVEQPVADAVGKFVWDGGGAELARKIACNPHYVMIECESKSQFERMLSFGIIPYENIREIDEMPV